MTKDPSTIKSYHVHIYFNVDEADKANNLASEVAEKFGTTKGRVHLRPVGPHPMPSCLLWATPEQFEQLLPWLTLNRDGLTIFAHPETGDDLADHRDHPIWLGKSQELRLDLFG